MPSFLSQYLIVFLCWSVSLLLFFCVCVCLPAGDGQVDFEEFMTILGPKLLSSDNREGFLGNTIDNIFWQVRDKASSSQLVNSLLLITHSPHHLSVQSLMLPLTSSASPLTMYFNSQNKSYIFENSPSFSKNSAGKHKTYTHTQNTLSAPLPAFAVPLHSFLPPFLDLSLKGKETC